MPATHLVVNQIAGHIRRLPIRGVTFYDVDNEEGTHFFQTKQGSKWELKPKVRALDTGGYITLGWNAEIQLFIANNHFNMYTWQLSTRLERLRNRYINTQLLLGLIEPPTVQTSPWKYYPPANPPYFDYPLQNHITTKMINAGGYMIADFGNNLVFNFELNQNDIFPSLTINLSGIIKNTIDISYPGKETLTDIDKYFFK